MLIHDFKKECDEWLNPLGWSLYQISQNCLKYSNINSVVSIDCLIDASNNKSIRLCDYISYKYWLKLESGVIQFKHSDFEEIVRIFEHYGNLAQAYPPF
jgi:hypothetical protein